MTISTVVSCGLRIQWTWLKKGVPNAESSRSVRGLGKGVSGKPYPRLCNARRPRLESGTFRSQADTMDMLIYWNFTIVQVWIIWFQFHIWLNRCIVVCSPWIHCRGLEEPWNVNPDTMRNGNICTAPHAVKIWFSGEKNFLKKHVASYKVPKMWLVIDTMKHIYK